VRLITGANRQCERCPLAERCPVAQADASRSVADIMAEALAITERALAEAGDRRDRPAAAAPSLDAHSSRERPTELVRALGRARVSEAVLVAGKVARLGRYLEDSEEDGVWAASTGVPTCSCCEHVLDEIGSDADRSCAPCSRHNSPPCRRWRAPSWPRWVRAKLAPSPFCVR